MPKKTTEELVADLRDLRLRMGPVYHNTFNCIIERMNELQDGVDELFFDNPSIVDAAAGRLFDLRSKK